MERPAYCVRESLYNYIDLDVLRVRIIDLSMKLRLNNKVKRIRRYHRILGMAIAKRPVEMDNCQEYDHWEMDTIEGQRSDDNALLTLIDIKGETIMPSS